MKINEKYENVIAFTDFVVTRRLVGTPAAALAVSDAPTLFPVRSQCCVRPMHHSGTAPDNPKNPEIRYRRLCKIKFFRMQNSPFFV